MKSAQTKYEEAIARNWPTFLESAKSLLTCGDEKEVAAMAKSEVSILRTKIGLKKGDQRYDEQLKTLIATASNLLENRKASEKKAKQRAEKEEVAKPESDSRKDSSESKTTKDKKSKTSGKHSK